jgi:hypothetical protein
MGTSGGGLTSIANFFQSGLMIFQAAAYIINPQPPTLRSYNQARQSRPSAASAAAAAAGETEAAAPGPAPYLSHLSQVFFRVVRILSQQYPACAVAAFATDGRTDCDSTASHDDDGVTLIIVSSRVSESLQFCIFLDTNFHLLFFHQTGRPTKKKVQETEE